MASIFTITGNLLAETTATFNFPKVVGQTVRAISPEKFQSGGKGVNTARIAKMLGFDAYAGIFPAGYNGKKCVEFIEKYCPVISVEISGETRTGLVCETPEGMQTTFLGADLPVPEHAFERLLSQFEKLVNPSDVIALCGSFPNWKDSHAKYLSDFAKDHSLILCADTYGKPLESLLKNHVELDLLKINRAEMFAFLGESDNKSADAFETAFLKFCKKANAKYIGVSDAQNPAYFCNNAEIFSITPTKLEAQAFPTGCGDAMLATLICGIFLENHTFKHSAQEAIEIATFSATLPETVPTDAQKLKEIFKR